MTSRKLYGTSHISDLEFEVPSGEGEAFLSFFAPSARKPGNTITGWSQQISESGRRVIISFDYTAVHASSNWSSRPDMEYNIDRWGKKAALKIGAGSHRARRVGSCRCSFVQKPHPTERLEDLPGNPPVGKWGGT